MVHIFYIEGHTLNMYDNWSHRLVVKLLTWWKKNLASWPAILLRKKKIKLFSCTTVDLRMKKKNTYFKCYHVEKPDFKWYIRNAQSLTFNRTRESELIRGSKCLSISVLFENLEVQCVKLKKKSWSEALRAKITGTLLTRFSQHQAFIRAYATKS